MKLYVSRTGRRVWTVRSDFRRRNDYPYGKWTCADGREVLFNRFYEPLWQRRPGGDVEPSDPHERVPWTDQNWFYDDNVRDRQKLAAGKVALREWGIPDPWPTRQAKRDSGNDQGRGVFVESEGSALDMIARIHWGVDRKP